MAVVIRGSFDEGPITLALPDYFEGSLGVETDPIFTAWDKSTGISIPVSQVSDFDTEVSNNTDVTLNTAKNTYPTADASKLAAITGTNTGDTVGHDVLVPYTGASGDVTLGGYDLIVGKITIGDTPSSPTDGATKAYVDSIVATGISWQTAVIDIITNAAALPGGPTVYDRYITIDDNHIREWGGASWSDTTPSSGDTLYVSGNSIDPVNDVGIHTYNGSNWVYIGGSVNHNDTTNIQGGSPGNRWHLDSANYTAAVYTTTTTADAVPTNLALSSEGISTGNDGTQSAYVVLTWDAISTSTFDHYHVQYKKTAFTYYQSLDARTNTITIEGLTPNTSYDFRVASVNKYGTSSAYCTALVLTTSADSDAPATVTLDSATAGIQYVILEWTHNTESDLASYNIYRHTANVSGSSVLIGNCRTNYFVDGGLTGDIPYYYWVKAVDTSGNVSAAYSSTATATPRNVTTSDVTAIASTKILIDGAVYLSNWRHTSDVTKIDGGDIYANSVTTTQVSFVPLVSFDANTGSIIGTINASAEALTIEGQYIEINGQTTFTPIEGDGGARVFIFPDVNTGLKITDDNADDVFNVQIGGTNVGDVTIGNYVGGQGIKYDRSAGTTTFKGAIYASSGTISGLLSFGTEAIVDGGNSSNIALKGNNIWENTHLGNNSSIKLNGFSYGGGLSYYRSLFIGNGKGKDLFSVLGYDESINVYGELDLDHYSTYSPIKVGLILPVLTRTQILTLTKRKGLVVYNDTIDQFCFCLEYPSGSGTLQWRYPSTSAMP